MLQTVKCATMKIMHSLINVSEILVLLLFSCSRGSNGIEETASDTSKPMINIVDPINNKTVILGSKLHLQMDLSDNVELKSYKIVIKKGQKGVATSDWAFSQTWPITSGKKTFSVNQDEIAIPLTVTGNQTTTGNYTMEISCLDSSSNESLLSLSLIVNN